MKAIEGIDLNKFIQIKVLGKGGQGKVYQVQEKATKQFYAAKIIKIEKSMQKTTLHYIAREVNILLMVNHPAILQFKGISYKNFKNKSFPTILTEYLPNGSLSDILTEHPKEWDDTQKLITLYGIASGMSYLHSNNILHRDLKPGNILEDENYYPKIADFGLSKIVHENQDSITEESTKCEKGTRLYMAPEVIKKKTT